MRNVLFPSHLQTVVRLLSGKQILGMGSWDVIHANICNSSTCSWDFIADYTIQHGTSLCSIFVTKTPSQFLVSPQPGTRMTKWGKDEVSKCCSAIIEALGFYHCCFSQKSRAPCRLLQKMVISSQPDAVHFLIPSGKAVTSLFGVQQH